MTNVWPLNNTIEQAMYESQGKLGAILTNENRQTFPPFSRVEGGGACLASRVWHPGMREAEPGGSAGFHRQHWFHSEILSPKQKLNSRQEKQNQEERRGKCLSRANLTLSFHQVLFWHLNSA